MTCKDCLHYKVCEGYQVDDRACKLANDCVDYLDKYATELCIEKQIPKQPIKSDRQIRYCEVFYCPTCNFEISGRIARFCYKCGQALDWSE